MPNEGCSRVVRRPSLMLVDSKASLLLELLLALALARSVNAQAV